MTLTPLVGPRCGSACCTKCWCLGAPLQAPSWVDIGTGVAPFPVEEVAQK
jgi:hypothetical protein